MLAVVDDEPYSLQHRATTVLQDAEHAPANSHAYAFSRKLAGVGVNALVPQRGRASGEFNVVEVL